MANKTLTDFYILLDEIVTSNWIDTFSFILLFILPKGPLMLIQLISASNNQSEKEKHMARIREELVRLQEYRDIGIHVTDQVKCGYNWYFNHVFFFCMTGMDN